MRVLAFVSDLTFHSKIDAAARHAGAEVVYGKAEDAEAAADAAKPALVLVDLGLKGVDAPKLIAALHAQTGARVVAFGSHVDGKSIAAAHAAGAELALPRSAFTKHIVDILRGGNADGSAAE